MEAAPLITIGDVSHQQSAGAIAWAQIDVPAAVGSRGVAWVLEPTLALFELILGFVISSHCVKTEHGSAATTRARTAVALGIALHDRSARKLI